MSRTKKSITDEEYNYYNTDEFNKQERLDDYLAYLYDTDLDIDEDELYEDWRDPR